MPDHTIDIGYVHVGGYRSVPINSTTGVHHGQVWTCADNCPHPSHAEESQAHDPTDSGGYTTVKDDN